MGLPGRSFEAGDLMLGDDHDFVVTLYLALLRRWPDPAGYRRYLAMVENRPEARAEAIREVAASEEAQRAGAPLVIRPGPILPSDPRRAQAAVLAIRTEWLAAQLAEMREALALLGGPGGPELAGLGAELIESRDAELRSEINALRREMGQRLDAALELLRDRGLPVPAEAAATAEERAAAMLARLFADYVNDLLAAQEARFEARLRAIEARLLALAAGPPAP